MITFTIILVTLLALVAAVALIVLAGGVGVILAFGDLIVCGGIGNVKIVAACTVILCVDSVERKRNLRVNISSYGAFGPSGIYLT